MSIDFQFGREFCNCGHSVIINDLHNLQGRFNRNRQEELYNVEPILFRKTTIICQAGSHFTYYVMYLSEVRGIIHWVMSPQPLEP
jgi:hypothetical protein